MPSTTWTGQDLDAVFPWSKYLPLEDQDEFLREINTYVGEHHENGPEWADLTDAWHTTARLWYYQRGTVLPLVENLEAQRLPIDPDAVIPADWYARQRIQVMLPTMHHYFGRIPGSTSGIINQGDAPQPVGTDASICTGMPPAPSELKGSLGRTARRTPLWRRVVRTLTGIDTRKAEA